MTSSVFTTESGSQYLLESNEVGDQFITRISEKPIISYVTGNPSPNVLVYEKITRIIWPLVEGAAFLFDTENTKGVRTSEVKKISLVDEGAEDQ